MMNFSVIVPTYKEAKNVAILAERFAKIDFGCRSFELIFVDDDSQDSINTVIFELQKKYPWIILKNRKKPRSLSLSVLEGFELARYDIIVLMDADLSHPPEKINEMLPLLENDMADFVIGSRYTEKGSTASNWPLYRKSSSIISALIAKFLLGKGIKDPLSGFFALKKQTLTQAKNFEPIGWKIGLEIMLKCRCTNIKEVPIHFSERLHGKSKLNMKIMFDFIRHVNSLLIYKFFSQK